MGTEGERVPRNATRRRQATKQEPGDFARFGDVARNHAELTPDQQRIEAGDTAERLTAGYGDEVRAALVAWIDAEYGEGDPGEAMEHFLELKGRATSSDGFRPGVRVVWPNAVTDGGRDDLQ